MSDIKLYKTIKDILVAPILVIPGMGDIKLYKTIRYSTHLSHPLARVGQLGTSFQSYENHVNLFLY